MAQPTRPGAVLTPAFSSSDARLATVLVANLSSCSAASREVPECIRETSSMRFQLGTIRFSVRASSPAKPGAGTLLQVRTRTIIGEAITHSRNFPNRAGPSGLRRAETARRVHEPPRARLNSESAVTLRLREGEIESPHRHARGGGVELK